MVPELITHGRVIRGDIGISHVTVTEKGLRIARITAGGPAEKAGLRGPRVTRRGPVTLIDRGAADIIVAVDGQEIHNAAEFLGIFESKKPGEVVELTILRDGQPARVRVTLGSDTSGPESKGF